MKVEEVGAACVAAIVHGTDITFYLPEKEKFPPGWPRGELLCVVPSGKSYSFDPLKILSFLQKLQKLNNTTVGDIPNEQRAGTRTA